MNWSRLLALQPRFLSTAAGTLATGLLATTVSAQSYVPRAYAPQPAAYAPYAAAPAYYAQPYGAPPSAVPAAYRIPMMTARPQAPYQYCPPGQQPYGAAPQAPLPPGTTPEQMPQPQSGQTQQPDASGGAQQPTNQNTTDPFRQDNAQNNAPQDQQNPTSQNDFTPTDAGSRANQSPGMNTPQLGRNDQTNRLNLFDNMAAVPQNRVWFGMQYASGFDTALQLTDDFKFYLAGGRYIGGHPALIGPVQDPDTVLLLNQGITTKFFQYSQRLYRVGGEWAPTDYLSVAVQGQYYGSNGTTPDAAPDDFTNPQIMTKLVLAQDCDTVLSATVGITPETENEIGDINEGVTKIYPGLLFYEGLTEDLFMQGGVQAGMPVHGRNEVYTFDWSLALGYWLYRDPCPCGPGRPDRPDFLRRFKVTGIIPQVNVLGKHTVGNNRTVGPFGFAAYADQIVTSTRTDFFEICDPVTGLPVPGVPPVLLTVPTSIDAFILPEGFVIYREPRDIIDLTVGGQILFGDHLQLSLGYSVPLSDESVRDGEFTSTLTVRF